MKTAVLSAVSGGNDVEVLIVDDGSTDDSLLILQEYAKNNKNISYNYLLLLWGGKWKN